MEIQNRIQTIKGEIEARLKNEYEAFYLYTAASAWCQIAGYTNAAAYFRKEAENEVYHAQSLQDFMNNWGLSYSMPTVDTAIVFDSLPDIIDRLYRVMTEQYLAYERSADIALPVDKSTFQLLMEKVQAQYYAVTYYLTLKDKLAQIDPEDPNWLINFEQETFAVPEIPM